MNANRFFCAAIGLAAVLLMLRGRDHARGPSAGAGAGAGAGSRAVVELRMKRRGLNVAPAPLPAVADQTEPAHDAKPGARHEERDGNAPPKHEARAKARAAAQTTPTLYERREIQQLEALSQHLQGYGRRFHGNPVGTNAEITLALRGDNPERIAFLNPAPDQLNGRGELLDLWGTPYFFHQRSRDFTEIISAGPDRRMHTSDDLTH